LETYLATAIVLALSLLLGGALCSIGREGPRWDWLAPAVGLAAAIVVAWLAIRLPGAGVTAAVALALAAAAAVVRLWRRVAWTRLAAGAPPALLVAALSALPFLANDRIGVIGESINDDLAFHMDWAYALAEGGGITGRVADGYPVGPHAVVAALAEALGTTAEPVFTGLVLALPILTALTALAALEDAPVAARLAAATLPPTCYLGAELVLQSSFKELTLGLLVLAFAIVVGRLMKGELPPARALVIAALLAAAACTTFSLAALAWFVAGAALAWAAEAVLSRGWAGLRRVGVAALGMLAFIVVATVLLRVTGFFAAGPGRFTFYKEGPVVAGNLAEALSPLQLLSVWPSDDFRLEPDLGWWRVAVVLGAVAALTGLVRAALRREVGLLSVAVASVAIYAASIPLTNHYNSAKTLAVAAPVFTCAALVGLLGGGPPAGWKRLTTVALAAVWGLVALHSSGTLLRAAPVRAEGQSTDLRRLGAGVTREPVAFLGQDSFARWELRTADYVFSGGTVDLSGRPGTLRTGPVPAGAAVAVAPRTRHAPSAPPELGFVRGTRWYTLLRRTGANRSLFVTREGTAPGAVLSCRDRKSRALARRGWRALVKPLPVLGPVAAWTDTQGRQPFLSAPSALLGLDRTVQQTLALPSGRWELSLRYYSRDPITVSAGPVSATMPAYLADRTRFWRVGSVTSEGRPIAVSVRGGKSRPIQPRRFTELFEVAAVREDRPGRVVPLRRACGRYVDYATPPPR
jgi:hypothetical protein